MNTNTDTYIDGFVLPVPKANLDAKVMADPRMTEICLAHNPDAVIPFDCSKMAMGGFQAFVSA